MYPHPLPGAGRPTSLCGCWEVSVAFSPLHPAEHTFMGSRPEHVRTTTYCALMEITTSDKSSACAMLESRLINKEVLKVDPAGRSCGDVPCGGKWQEAAGSTSARGYSCGCCLAMLAELVRVLPRDQRSSSSKGQGVGPGSIFSCAPLPQAQPVPPSRFPAALTQLGLSECWLPFMTPRVSLVFT